MGRFDIFWLIKWDIRVTRKLIKFDLFCFKLFLQAVQKHQLGEVRNKITPSSCIFSGIFLPKIIKIEQCLTKLRLWKTGIFYLDSRCTWKIRQISCIISIRWRAVIQPDSHLYFSLHHSQFPDTTAVPHYHLAHSFLQLPNIQPAKHYDRSSTKAR